MAHCLFEKTTKSLTSTHGNRWIFRMHKEIGLNINFLLNSIVQEHSLMKYEFGSLGAVLSEFSSSLGFCFCSFYFLLFANLLPCLAWKMLWLATVQLTSWSHLGSEPVTPGTGKLDLLFQVGWYIKILQHTCSSRIFNVCYIIQVIIDWVLEGMLWLLYTGRVCGVMRLTHWDSSFSMAQRFIEIQILFWYGNS